MKFPLCTTQKPWGKLLDVNFQAATGSSSKVAAVAASQDQSHESKFAQSQFKAGGKSI